MNIRVANHMVSEYCEYQVYRETLCTADARLWTLLQGDLVTGQASQNDCGLEEGQWCGLRRLNANFDEVMVMFARIFGPELNGKVDLFMCAHPLYWCRLFDRLPHPPGILGVWDVSHNFAVPLELQESWNLELVSKFQNPRNLLVAQCAYHSFQVKWLLGLSIPYYQPLAIRTALQGRYNPVHKTTVLLSVFHTPYGAAVLKRVAAVVPDMPYRLVSWHDDLSCGVNCSKVELARFRAVVLDAYDVANFKLAEFYGMAVPIFICHSSLWRTAMRLARTQAFQAGPLADAPGRIPSRADNSWSSIIAQETLTARLHEPWPLVTSVSKRQEVSEASDRGLPFSPFTSDPELLFPPGAAFWAQLTEWNVLPHLLRYHGAADLISQLGILSMGDLASVSRQMASHYREMCKANLGFWHGLIAALIADSDASAWKGPASFP